MRYVSLHGYVCMCVLCIHLYVYNYICIYIYIYMERERERWIHMICAICADGETSIHVTFAS